MPFRPAEDGDGDGVPESSSALEVDVTAGGGGATSDRDDGAEEGDGDGWEFVVVLEGQENEIKCVAFSPSGQYLATCSRDKSIWIWEDVGGDEDEDEWETVAVLKEHDGDVKCVAWCPDVAGRSAGSARHYSAEALASASYDNTVRIWREDGDGDWVCVAVLEGHAGIVWGVQWEPRPDGDSYPRLASWSADRTIRIWTLQQEDEDHDGGASEDAAPPSCLIPNTMRRSLHERWQCAATLPAVHAREIYSATWSATTGLVASAGGDGLIAVYGEAPAETASDATMDQAAMELGRRRRYQWRRSDGGAVQDLADSGYHGERTRPLRDQPHHVVPEIRCWLRAARRRGDVGHERRRRPRRPVAGGVVAGRGKGAQKHTPTCMLRRVEPAHSATGAYPETRTAVTVPMLHDRFS